MGRSWGGLVRGGARLAKWSRRAVKKQGKPGGTKHVGGEHAGQSGVAGVHPDTTKGAPRSLSAPFP